MSCILQCTLFGASSLNSEVAMTIEVLTKMASSSRIGLDSVVGYCTGEGLSDSELENELDEMEVESDDEELEWDE